MAVTKADITTLAGSLCHDLDDSTTIGEFFDDMQEEIVRSRRPPFIGSGVFTVASGTATRSTSQAFGVIGFVVNDEYVREVTLSDLEAYSTTWRTDTGTPIVFTYGEQASQTIRFYPKPDATFTSQIELYPKYLAADIPEWFALPFAFLTLSFEFEYPSDHQDKNFADVCEQIGKLLYQMADAGVTY